MAKPQNRSNNESGFTEENTDGFSDNDVTQREEVPTDYDNVKQAPSEEEEERAETDAQGPKYRSVADRGRQELLEREERSQRDRGDS